MTKAPRVYADLKAQGVMCSRRRVARLMREAGLRGKEKRKYKTTTDSDHALPIAENLVQREPRSVQSRLWTRFKRGEFDVAEPNKVWAADITYVSTKEGWLYRSCRDMT